MVAERETPNLEVPEAELVEELSSEADEEQLAPLDTHATSVSEADWVDQQQSAPVDEDDREDETED